MKFLLMLVVFSSCTFSPALNTHHHTHEETYLIKPDSIEKVLTEEEK